ncbi:MAG: hypothetical protein QW590_02730 [Candidatus Bilamarchaeaceae archaeon]
MPPRHVVIDTNFFLIPYQFKIDIFSELEGLVEIHHIYVITSKTIKELEKLAQNQGKTGAAARLALKIIQVNKERLEIVQSNSPVDRWIEKYAYEKGAIVCTNDKQLKSKLRENGIKVISLKGKKQLGYA